MEGADDMRELEQYRIAMKGLPEGCTAAEAEAEKQKKLSVEVVDGVPGAMSCSEQTELFVRASGEKTGMVYTQKLDENPAEVIAQALRNSEASQRTEPEIMCSPAVWEQVQAQRMAQGESEEILLTPEEENQEAAVGRLLDFGKKLTAELKPYGRDGARIRVDLEQTILTMGLVNSNGMDVTASTCRYGVSVSMDGGYHGFVSARNLEEVKAEPFIDGIRQRSLLELPVIPTQPGTYRAVLSSRVVNYILITAWQMFTANRAQSGSTPLAGKLGQQVFSQCVTIRDYKGGKDSKNEVTCGFSWQIDCEGVPSQDVTLMENGVLKNWMYNMASAAADGVVSTGNAGRKALLSGNIHTTTVTVPKNFTMESGEASLEELFEACGDGVYVFENYDQFHALNVVSGDFAFPCKAARIEGGKLTGLWEGLTMNGNVCRLFGCVEQVGRDRILEPMSMYDSYEVSGPSMLVSELRISG